MSYSMMRACHSKSNTDIDRNKKVSAANQLTIGRQFLEACSLSATSLQLEHKNFAASPFSYIASRLV